MISVHGETAIHQLKVPTVANVFLQGCAQPVKKTCNLQ